MAKRGRQASMRHEWVHTTMCYSISCKHGLKTAVMLHCTHAQKLQAVQANTGMLRA